MQSVQTRFYRKTANQEDYGQHVRSSILEQCRKEDADASGLVAADAFFQILGQVDIKLSPNEKQLVRNEHGKHNGERLRYERVCKCLYYLKDSHEWFYSSIKNKAQAQTRYTRGQGWATLQNETFPEPYRPAHPQVIDLDAKSRSTTFTQLVSPRRFGHKDKLTQVSREADPRAFLTGFSKQFTNKKDYLAALLQGSSPEEQEQVTAITQLAKLLYKHHQVQPESLN